MVTQREEAKRQAENKYSTECVRCDDNNPDHHMNLDAGSPIHLCEDCMDILKTCLSNWNYITKPEEGRCSDGD